MKNIYTNIFSFNNKVLKKTIKALKQGNIAGLPTETVYGLAGNAYSIGAVRKIFKLKKRPKKNPLIIHFYDKKNLKKDVKINNHFSKLYDKLCPGPITFVLNLNKNSIKQAKKGSLDYSDYTFLRKDYCINNMYYAI